jgi:hypothetical protein
MTLSAGQRSVTALPRFLRVKKKWPARLQRILDVEARKILENPLRGDPKKGALAGIRVHKFTHQQHLYLIGYQVGKGGAVCLLALGSHENFYRDLEKQIATR